MPCLCYIHIFTNHNNLHTQTHKEEKNVLVYRWFFAFIVSLLSLWVNASAFGMEEDGTPQSEYEKMLGLGAKLKDKETAAKERESARFHPDD